MECRLEETIEKIKEETPLANLRPLALDFSTLSGAREAAVTVNAYPEVIHVCEASALLYLITLLTFL